MARPGEARRRERERRRKPGAAARGPKSQRAGN